MRVGKGALAPCPPAIGSVILNGGHASLLPTPRTVTATELRPLSRSSRGRVGVGVLPQNALVERIDFPPPDALFRTL